jgi:hypothetical protein
MEPFDSETIELYQPVTMGEHTAARLVFRAPRVKDLLYAGSKYPEGTIPFTLCLISSLTGEPEQIIERLVPEDWANAVVVADRTYQRFCGHINLFEKKKDATENPTMAGTPPGNSSEISAVSPES